LDAGVLKVAVECLTTPAPVVNYEAITLARILLIGPQGENPEAVEKFVALNGIDPLLERTAPPKEDEDPRVMYEASRLLCRLLKLDYIQEQIGEKALAPVLALSQAPFSLLRDEGTTALLRWSEKAENLSAVANRIDDILQIFTKLKLSDQYDQKIPLRISGIILDLLKNDTARSMVSASHLEQLSEFLQTSSASLPQQQNQALGELLGQMQNLLISGKDKVQVGK